MQPTRVKTSFAEDVKLLSNALPLLSVFFPPFSFEAVSDAAAGVRRQPWQ